MILMYFGGLILFKNSINLIFDPLRKNDGSPSDRLRLDSIIFNTFVEDLNSLPFCKSFSGIKYYP